MCLNVTDISILVVGLILVIIGVVVVIVLIRYKKCIKVEASSKVCLYSLCVEGDHDWDYVSFMAIEMGEKYKPLTEGQVD